MSPIEARDAMFGAVKNAWAAHPEFQIIWNDKQGMPRPDVQIWCRPIIRTSNSTQSLPNEHGQRLHTDMGLIMVQVFSQPGDGYTAGYIAANLVQLALSKAKFSGLWLRNVRLNEIGKTNGWEQFNVIADFSYDDVR